MASAVVVACGGGDEQWETRLARGSMENAVVDVPVAFDVVDQNRSLVPCPTDGFAHTVRGHLVAPASLLDAQQRSATLYVHGGGAGEWAWHLTALPAYDYATEMAKLGHASIVLDRLGFDASDHPNGFMTCNGGEADVVDQMLGQLRRGEYTAGEKPGPAFERIALAGHSLGVWIAEITGYSFPGSADAIVGIGWADLFPTSPKLLFDHVPEVGLTAFPNCGLGGQPSEKGAPDAELHAAHFVSSDDVTLEIIPQTGHFGMIERNAPVLRERISDWLSARGF